MPEGNQHLFIEKSDGCYINDDFRHELALYTNGLLFTGCAHSGLENILAACPYPVHTVVGGFHLLDGLEAEEELAALAQRLKAKYPETQFHTSHCTGDKVFAMLKTIINDSRGGDGQQTRKRRGLAVCRQEERQHRHNKDAKAEARGSLNKAGSDTQ